MEQVSYTLRLDLKDTGLVNTGFRLKQGDSGMKLTVSIYNRGVSVFDSYTVPKIVFRRPDGASVMANMTVGSSVYEYVFVGNELQQPGVEIMDVKFTLPNDRRESTLSCSFIVVPDTITPNTHGSDIYDNDLSEWLAEILEHASELKGIESITKTGSSGYIDTYTILYSDGSTDTFQITNGKSAYDYAVEGGYEGTEEEFAEYIADIPEYVDDAEAAATLSESYAKGGTNTRTGENTDNSYYYSQQSLASSQEAEAQADRAEFYADFVTPHFIIVNNRLYMRDDAGVEFTVANNRLYIKSA